MGSGDHEAEHPADPASPPVPESAPAPGPVTPRRGVLRTVANDRLTESLAILGVLVLVVSLTLILNGVHSPAVQALILIALVLLFLAALNGVRAEPRLVRALVFVGATLCLLVAVTTAVITSTQSSAPAPQTSCSLLAPLTPVPLQTAVGQSIYGPPAATPQPQPAIEVAAKWPHNMDVTGSDFIGVVLSHKLTISSGKPIVPTIVVGGAPCNPASTITGTAAPGTATPAAVTLAVGTPGVFLERAFGRHYQAYASAGLEAIKFDLTPISPQWQLVDQRSNEDWAWTISPQAAGRQIALLSVDVQWRPAGAEKGLAAIPPRRIWESGPLYIQVQEPVLSAGQIQVSTVLSALFTTAVTTLITALIAKFLTSKSR